MSSAFCALGQADAYSSRGRICVAAAAGPGGLVTATATLRNVYCVESTRTLTLGLAGTMPSSPSICDTSVSAGATTGLGLGAAEEGGVEVCLYMHSSGLDKVASQTCALNRAPSTPNKSTAAAAAAEGQVVASVGESKIHAFHSMLWHPSGDRILVVSGNDLFVLQIKYMRCDRSGGGARNPSDEVSLAEAVSISRSAQSEGFSPVAKEVLTQLRVLAAVDVAAAASDGRAFSVVSAAAFDASRYAHPFPQCVLLFVSIISYS